MRARATSVLFAVVSFALAVAHVSAEPLVARQAAATTNESTIIFTIQTDTVLESTTSQTAAPFGNSTFTTSSSSSTPRSTPTSTSSSQLTSNGESTATSIALTTYTIPQSGGGVITSTAFAAPSTSTKLPSVQPGAGNQVAANLNELGLLGAVAVVAMNMI
ncbi:uncharacterized protein PV09_04500 [Verruconis gallopava]|uniref:Uncharacterized protein n=1 Tax=Verruconis gallopava TaxID=253628 RepID=A0A0D1XNP0_9PEZI|nr:uncharacterized protein PV09_04500 [Verruconis gallopava]KIW04191.1 hypothetical protein PV09_04500 [Verruconis gallopava]